MTVIIITTQLLSLPRCALSINHTLTHSHCSRLRTPNIYLCSILFIFINTKKKKKLKLCSFILLCTLYIIIYIFFCCWPSFGWFLFCFAFGNLKSFCRLELFFCCCCCFIHCVWLVCLLGWFCVF